MISRLAVLVSDGLLTGANLLSRLAWGLRPSEVVSFEREETFRKVMLVFREYRLDLDSDIEGCTGHELEEIDNHFAAMNELRRRVVAHVVDGVDARGQLRPPAP